MHAEYPKKYPSPSLQARFIDPVDALDSSHSRYKEQLATLTEDYEKLQLKLDATIKNNQTLERKLLSANYQLQHLESHSVADMQRCTAEMDKLRSELLKARTALKETATRPQSDASHAQIAHLESEIVLLTKTIDGHKRMLKEKQVYIENLEKEVCRLPGLVGQVSELTDENRTLQELCNTYKEQLNELREGMPYSPPIPDLQAEEMQGEQHVWINEDALGTNYGILLMLLLLYPFKSMWRITMKLFLMAMRIVSIATWPARTAISMPMRLVRYISNNSPIGSSCKTNGG